MTKERRLAIQMWEEIREAIRTAERPSDVNTHFITSIKLHFVQEHKLYWVHNCWFCTYVRYSYIDRDIHGEGCQRCPLSDGSADAINGYKSGCHHNAYSKVFDARMRKTKLKACDEIINALKGVLK